MAHKLVSFTPIMKKKILIAEDDSGLQDVLQIVFERAGYEVAIHENANGIITGAFEVPDLYILDKQLSGVDGLDVCRHLKDKEHTLPIPVIVISASHNVGKLAEEAGCDGFLAKPFNNGDLLKMVARLLEKNK